MSPELSIIILTVLAGAGQGLFVFIVAGDYAGLMKGASLSENALIAGAVVSFVLTLVGALASLFHLTHPERGVKAVKQWKSSWLSREALFLPLFQGMTALYAAAAYFGVSPGLRLTVGAVGVIAALALFLASGMIYAEIRYIREWNTAYTPVNFALIGMASGGAAAIAVLETAGAPAVVTLSVLRAVFGVTIVAALVKLLYFKRNASLYSPFTLQSAIGVNHSLIRLMDTGASYDHYNTTEYNYTAFRSKRGMLRAVSFLLLFAAPAALMTLDYMPLFRNGTGWMGAPAALLMIAGAMIERWLFFVDGNHAQNLYYGAFMDKGAANPILQGRKRDAPLPPR